MSKALRATVIILVVAFVFSCRAAAEPTPERKTAPAVGKKQTAAKAPARRNNAKFVLIVADGVNLKELNDPVAFPGFHGAARKGAAGLMITGASGARERVSAYASIGAGGQMTGIRDAAEAYNVGVEPLPSGQTVLEAWLARMTGEPPALESDTVLNLGLPRLAALNARRESRPGALGELLSKNGWSVCVYGNADYDGKPRREVSLIGMDLRGAVLHGDVEWTAIADVTMKAPFTAAPDLDLLKDAFSNKYINDDSAEKPYSCDLIVIEFGDTARAEEFRAEADPLAAKSRKRQALERLDHFLAATVKSADLKTTQIMLISPTPPEDAVRLNESMTPVLAVGGGIAPGALTSATTRGKGLLTSADIAPHILTYFGVAVPHEMTGSPLKSLPAGNATASLLRLQFMDAMRLRMGRLLQTSILLSLFVIILAYLTVMRMPRVPRDWQRTLGVGLSICAGLFPALIIASLIFIGAFDSFKGDFLNYIAYFAIPAVLLGGAVAMLPRAEWRALTFIIIYVLLYGVDAALGGAMSRGSVLASSPQQSLRFFGAENTVAGLLLGASLSGIGLGLDLLRERVKGARWVFVGGLFAVAALIGIPVMGANYGMLLVTCVAFAIYGTLIARKRIRLGEVMVLIAVAAAAFVLFAGVSAAISSKAHLPFSRTFARVQAEGGAVTLAKIILWRIASNLRYVRTVNAWSVFFTGLFFFGTAIYYFPNQRIESLFRRVRFLNHALITALLCALAAFTLIYPGVVPAASLLFVPVLVIIMLAVNPSHKPAGEQNRERGNGRGQQPQAAAAQPAQAPSPQAPAQPAGDAPAKKDAGQPQQQRQGGRGRDDSRRQGQGPRKSGGDKRSDGGNRQERQDRRSGQQQQQRQADRPKPHEKPAGEPKPGDLPPAPAADKVHGKGEGEGHREGDKPKKQRYYYRDGKRYYGRGGGGKRPPSGHDGGNKPGGDGGSGS